MIHLSNEALLHFAVQANRENYAPIELESGASLGMQKDAT